MWNLANRLILLYRSQTIAKTVNEVNWVCRWFLEEKGLGLTQAFGVNADIAHEEYCVTLEKKFSMFYNCLLFVT